MRFLCIICMHLRTHETSPCSLLPNRSFTCSGRINQCMQRRIDDLILLTIGYMPQGPNVAICLCIVSNAKQDLSYFYMWVCCPFFKRLARLSGQLANA